MTFEDATLKDTPARVDITGPEPLARAFRPYERFHLVLHHDDGTTDTQVRDIIRAGDVVGVLGYDPVRDLVVLIRQFRLTTHLAHDHGELVEIVAGLVEKGESYEATAVRECQEEAGVTPSHLIPMVRFAPSPGVSDEFAVLFLGLMDSSALPERAGAADEAETTRPFAVPLEAAYAAVTDGRCINGYLLVALQWLMLNRARLPALIAAAQEA